MTPEEKTARDESDDMVLKTLRIIELLKEKDQAMCLTALSSRWISHRAAWGLSPQAIF